MNIAIEEILAAIDMAAAKTLGRQQLNLKYAGLNLTGKESQEKALLKLSGNTLIIEPEILRAEEASVHMKISIKQRDKAGETTPLLATQCSYVRLPISKFFPDDIAANVAVFTTLSWN